MPVDDVLGEYAARSLTRREFFGVAAAAGAVGVAAGTGTLQPRRAAAGEPRIVIVGAGLAGLRCAHQLWVDGAAVGRPIASTVYEADTTHVGGRCWSLRDYFSAGAVAEHGGAFINTGQRRIRRLAARLGLHEEVVNGGDLRAGEEVFFVGGQRYSYAEANADWAAVGFDAFHDAAAAAGPQPNYKHSTPEGRRLDNLAVPEWLDESGIGATSRFGRLMQANAVSEYGGNPSDQSALNLIYLLAWNARDSLQPLPGDDERFHIVGGNDQIVSRMAAQLPSGAVKMGYELIAVKANGDRGYTCSFQSGNAVVDVAADHVVLALPFSTLRRVDLRHAGLSPLKLHAIRSQGMGDNAKIHVELERKTWPALGYAGATYTDWDKFCTAWDGSVPLGAGGAPAILVAFPGGRAGAHKLTGAAHGPAPTPDVTWFLEQVEHVFPGTIAAHTGVAYEDHWAVDPWHLGSYSYYRVGQFHTISGSEHRQEGNLHFAGEHTSVSQQGFLEGAVESGERAAREIGHQI
ncbi:MAG: hypothetical protein JWL83_2186 [Actinomycetia bacterium]|nr:hypothetical protein [Actinomycetes bacterium]